MSSTEQHIDLTKVELPEPGTWVIDPGHSELAFVARHLMVAKVRGRFDDVTGAIHLADDPEESWVEVTVQTASIDSKNADRDKDLRSPNFLDVERYPEMTFRSTKVEPTGEATFRLTGDLTIRDVTKPVVLEAEYLGQSVAPWGQKRIGFEARGQIQREDWGVSWNMPLEAGGWVVSKGVQLEISIEASRAEG